MANTVYADDTSGMLTVHQQQQNADSEVSIKFPYVWLRHNCRCELCFHPTSKARLVQLQDFEVDIKPKHTQVTVEGNISVTWTGGHRSTYPYSFLQEKNLTTSDRRQRYLAYRKAPVLWDSCMAASIPRIHYQDVIENPTSMYQWLLALEVHGICLLTGAPKQEDLLNTLAEKVAFLKKTVYGSIFGFQVRPTINNLAFSSKPLSIHTDEPYYESTPGVQMLQCMTQVATEGGENFFIDAFYVAELLKKEYPEHFKLLTTVPVTFRNISKEDYKFDLLAKHPIIELDVYGELEKIYYNTNLADLDVPLETVQPLYAAMMKLDQLFYDERHCFQLKLTDGDIVCFNNQRVLHGRRGYKLLADGERFLRTAYIDWDDMRSKRRVLEQELDIAS